MSIFANFLVFFAISVCFASAIDKKTCCYSKQFYAKMTIVKGTVKNGSSIPEFTQNEFVLDYDWDMKRERAIGNYTIGYGPNKTIISYKAWNDYTSGNRYSYDSLSGSKCRVSSLQQSGNGTGQFPHCVPDTLKYQESYVFGSGNDAVHVNSWEGTYHNLQYAITTTMNDCTLVTMNSRGERDGNSFVENIQVSNFVQGRVSGAGVLDIPSECLTT